jgi:hypothetical protein
LKAFSDAARERMSMEATVVGPLAPATSASRSRGHVTIVSGDAPETLLLEPGDRQMRCRARKGKTVLRKARKVSL